MKDFRSTSVKVVFCVFAIDVVLKIIGRLLLGPQPEGVLDVAFHGNRVFWFVYNPAPLQWDIQFLLQLVPVIIISAMMYISGTKLWLCLSYSLGACSNVFEGYFFGNVVDMLPLTVRHMGNVDIWNVADLMITTGQIGFIITVVIWIRRWLEEK